LGEVLKIEQELSTGLIEPNTLEKYINLKQKLNSVISNFYKSLEDLEHTGAVIKSIEQGLLDFPAKHFDKEIWLCWKEGENEIKFWHEQNEGFDGRKPINVSDETLV